MDDKQTTSGAGHTHGPITDEHRCDVCSATRAARAAYQRAWYARQKRNQPLEPDGLTEALAAQAREQHAYALARADAAAIRAR